MRCVSRLPGYFIAGVVAAFASGSPAAAQEGGTALTNATVVDVERGTLARGQTIVVRGGRIQQVGAANTVRIPRGATRVDLAGKFVIPGLWDMHVHIAENIPEGRAAADYYGSLFLAYGVTGVRDAGGSMVRLRAMDSLARTMPGTMPRLVYAGEKIGPRNNGPWTVDSVRSAIRSRRDGGASYIKLTPEYPGDLFTATVAECAAASVRCVAHLPAADSAIWFPARGRGSYEHLFNLSEHVSRVPASELFKRAREYDQPTFLQRVLYKLRLRRKPDDPAADRLATRDVNRDRAFFDRMAAANVWITPTLLLHHYMTRTVAVMPPAVDTQFSMAPFVADPHQTDAQRAAAAAHWALWVGLVRAMHTSGVPMLAGTDFFAEHAPGASLHAELVLLQDAGIPAPAVLRMATTNPARYLQADTLGTIAGGRVADLVVLRRNPLDDVRNASEIEMVMTSGHLVRRPALDSLKAKAKGGLSELRDYRAQASGRDRRR